MKKKILYTLLSFGITYLGVAQLPQQGTYIEEEKTGCIINKEYRSFIGKRVKKNIDSLEQNNANYLKGLPSYTHSVPLHWPLRMTADYQSTSGVYDYYIISSYADIDRVPFQKLDWMCNSDTEARCGDDQNGNDIVIQPYNWQSMDDEIIDVIAAADGVVADVYSDLVFDRNQCDPVEFGPDSTYHGGYAGNYVVLLHADGTYTVYAHLKYGSVPNFVIGDYVAQGQYLGKVGSGGNSGGPHLHFEVDVSFDGTYVEPWWDASGCNYELSESWWADQKPYYDPALLRIATHDAEPVSKTCDEYESGENEDVFLCNHFNEGSTMYIRVTMRDYLPGDGITVIIFNSSGTAMVTFTDVAEEYNNSINIQFETELDSYPDGQYRVRVYHDGQYYYHFFTVGCINTYSLSGAYSGTRGWLAGDWITSTSTISGSSTNNIRYEAENDITLNPGFHIAANAQLTAKINACTLGAAKTHDDENPVLQNQIQIFPNPNRGIFTVNLNYTLQTENSVNLRITDLNGKIVWEETFEISMQNFQVDISDREKGIYFLTVSSNTQSEVQKIIVQ